LFENFASAPLLSRQDFCGVVNNVRANVDKFFGKIVDKISGEFNLSGHETHACGFLEATFPGGEFFCGFRKKGAVS
jgi:hypothetical protein